MEHRQVVRVNRQQSDEASAVFGEVDGLVGYGCWHKCECEGQPVSLVGKPGESCLESDFKTGAKGDHKFTNRGGEELV